MKMKSNNLLKKLTLFIIFTCITGCPGPHLYQSWYKRSVSETEIKKALLECGAHNPIYEFDNFDSLYLCMVASGFSYLDGRTIILKRPLYSALNICTPNDPNDPNLAHIPEGRPIPEICNNIITRNTERRLNSYYCKTRREPTLECLP